MLLSLLEQEGDMSIKVEDCALCHQDHVGPLLHLEEPIRLKGEHLTYSYRIRCPLVSLHLLIRLPTSEDPEWHIAAVQEVPIDLLPHIETVEPVASEP